MEEGFIRVGFNTFRPVAGALDIEMGEINGVILLRAGSYLGEGLRVEGLTGAQRRPAYLARTGTAVETGNTDA